MSRSEIAFYFFNIALLTGVLAPLVLWQYRVAVLSGMQERQGAVVASEPIVLTVRRPHAGVLDVAAWEASLRRRVFIAVVGAMLPSAALLAALWLYVTATPPTPGRLLLQMAVTANIAVPIHALLMAAPFWRAVWLWVAATITMAIGLVLVAMLQRILTGGSPSFDQALLFVDFFKLIAITLGSAMLAVLATGARRVRGVAPMIFAGLLVVGLAPEFGRWLTQAFAGTRTGEMLFPLAGLDIVAVLLALPLGLVAWWRLKSLARAYEAKRFSDVQLLARTWWLLIVVNAIVGLIEDDQLVTSVVGITSYLLFPILFTRSLDWANPLDRRPPRRTLLLLRVFGYRSRTQTLFDRIASRWRLFGPVTMIAAPDVIARTVDPGDFLRFVSRHTSSTFVKSREDLDQRLAALDIQPDPDGRYRVTEFCCRATTWQATVVELIQRADVVIMDLRGFTPQRQGCEFELRELTARLAGEQVVLVVDDSTDRALLEESIGNRGAGGTQPKMCIVNVSRGSGREMEATFSAVRRAAYPCA